MKKISIYELERSGLIIRMPTGVIYTNQCGGTHCAHPEVEGALLPLSVEVVEDPLYDWWGTHCRPEDARHMLRGLKLDDWLRFDQEYIHPWGEAWIPTLIRDDIPPDALYPGDELRQFAGFRAIFTYPNSD